MGIFCPLIFFLKSKFAQCLQPCKFDAIAVTFAMGGKVVQTYFYIRTVFDFQGSTLTPSPLQ
jgi:hypothetical protein